MFIVLCTTAEGRPTPEICNYNGQQLFKDRAAADGLALIHKEAFPDRHYRVFALQAVS